MWKDVVREMIGTVEGGAPSSDRKCFEDLQQKKSLDFLLLLLLLLFQKEYFQVAKINVVLIRHFLLELFGTQNCWKYIHFCQK